MLLPEQATLGGLAIHGPSAAGLRLERVEVERAARTSVQGRPQGHGSLVRTRWYGGAVVSLLGWCYADSGAADATMQARWSALLRAAHLDNVPIAFRFIPRGEASWWRYDLYDQDPPRDQGSVAPWMAWEGAWTSPRAWAESEVEVSSSYMPGVTGPGSGLVWPLDWPLVWSSGAAGDELLSATNDGNTTAWPQLTITGPVVNPVVTNETTGQAIYTRATDLAAGATLVIDTYTRRMTAAGVERPDLLDTTQTTWWGLAPGTNLLRLSGTGMVAGQTALSATFRHARIF